MEGDGEMGGELHPEQGEPRNLLELCGTRSRDWAGRDAVALKV